LAGETGCDLACLFGAPDGGLASSSVSVLLAVVLVERVFFHWRLRCPLTVAMVLGSLSLTSLAVRPGHVVKFSVLDGLYPSRGHGATAGGMQVGYQVCLVRCMVCTVGVVMCVRKGPRWIRLRWSGLSEGNFPEVGRGIAISCEDDCVLVGDLDSFFVESGCASVITEESNGEQGVWEIRPCSAS
jgi:hypothetical protein